MLRIGTAWTTFSQTVDEPYHIACGMEWLDHGEYRYELQHPPLSRIAVAAGLWLSGYHSMRQPDAASEGNAILYERGEYWKALRVARSGNLIFYVLGCFFLYLFARRLFGDSAAFWATALFAHFPPIIGHARLATTDMACTAGFIAALYALDVWLKNANIANSIGLGAAFAFGTLSKFSFLPFFGVAALIALAFHGRLPRLRLLPVSIAVFLFLALAVYRFQSIDTTFDAPNVQNALSHTPVAIQKLFRNMPLGQIVRGVGEVAFHMKQGHPSYLLGHRGNDGWWYFFPVVLAFKTPIALWIFVFFAARDRRIIMLLLIAAAILGITMTSRIDLGVRHILPIYGPLCVAAGFAVQQLLNTPKRILAIIALVWYFGSSLWAWPNELSYFNELAGRSPEKILIDSDLDWGQDLERLRLNLKQRGIDYFVLGYFGSADLSRAGLPHFSFISDKPTTGWIAVSVSFAHFVDPSSLAWLNKYKPVERIGTSYDLYWIPTSP